MTRAYGLGGLLAVTTLVVSSLLHPLASPAHASGSCSIRVPDVRIDRQFTTVPVSLNRDCAASDMALAVWDVYQLGGDGTVVKGVRYTRGSRPTQLVGWYGDRHYSDGVGYYEARPVRAHDGSLNPLQQNTVRFTVRLASQVRMTATRSGDRVTMNLAATHYGTGVQAFRPWPGARFVVLSAPRLIGPWTHVHVGHVDSSGRATVQATAPSSRYFQAHMTGTPKVWGSSTVVVRR